MEILIVHQGYSGVDYHRIMIPFNSIGLGEHNVYSCSDLHAVDIEAINGSIDVVVFNRNISGKLQPEEIFSRLWAAGCAVVIDMDDYWYLPKTHALNYQYRHTNFSKCMEKQLVLADAVICTHELMRKEISTLRDMSSIFIARNAIDTNQPQFKDECRHNYENVYWQGSPTHRHDLALLSEVKNFTIAGYYKGDPEWEKIIPMFPDANLIPAANIDNYARSYDNQGIALIPLQDNKFNRMKSELKMIEAGYFKKAVIVSEVHPYTNVINRKNCLSVGVRQDWTPKIRGLLKNHKWQDDIRFELNELILNKYLIEHQNGERIKALDYAIRKSKAKNLSLAQRQIIRGRGRAERNQTVLPTNVPRQL